MSVYQFLLFHFHSSKATPVETLNTSNPLWTKRIMTVLNSYLISMTSSAMFIIIYFCSKQWSFKNLHQLFRINFVRLPLCLGSELLNQFESLTNTSPTKWSQRLWTSRITKYNTFVESRSKLKRLFPKKRNCTNLINNTLTFFSTTKLSNSGLVSLWNRELHFSIATSLTKESQSVLSEGSI